jgi:hypothetical protein
MSLEQLQRLVDDAERRPSLRQVLRLCSSWQEVLERARALGYGVTTADLCQARQDDAASCFLCQARIQPIGNLLAAVPGRGRSRALSQGRRVGAQLSWRRLASTSR